MSGRDDMVIRPRLKAPVASAQVRSREERRIDRLKRKGGLLHRLLRARAVRGRSRRRRMRSVKRTGSLARSGAGLARNTAARGAVMNPIGATIAVAAVAAAAAVRLATGRSFENMGQAINNILLGNMDEEARANLQTRKRLGGDSDIARIIGQEGRVNSQILSLHKDLAAMAKRDMVGASLIRSEKDMQVNNTLDMLLLRAEAKWHEEWRGSEGPNALKEILQKIRDDR